MEKGEIIDLSSLSKEEARKIVKKYFQMDLSTLNLNTIFCCSSCGSIVLRATMPDVKPVHDPNEEPYCTECNLQSGKYVRMDATIADL